MNRKKNNIEPQMNLKKKTFENNNYYYRMFLGQRYKLFLVNFHALLMN